MMMLTLLSVTSLPENAFARESAPFSADTICAGLPAEDEANCREAFEVLAKEPAPAVSFDMSIVLSRSASGWLYRALLNDNHTTGWTPCPESGPVTLPQSRFIELSVTAEETLFTWQVPELGISVDAVPGRINSIALRSDVTGVFSGHLLDATGKPIAGTEGDIRVLSEADFGSWQQQYQNRSC